MKIIWQQRMWRKRETCSPADPTASESVCATAQSLWITNTGMKVFSVCVFVCVFSHRWCWHQHPLITVTSAEKGWHRLAVCVCVQARACVWETQYVWLVTKTVFMLTSGGFYDIWIRFFVSYYLKFPRKQSFKNTFWMFTAQVPLSKFSRVL